MKKIYILIQVILIMLISFHVHGTDDLSGEWSGKIKVKSFEMLTFEDFLESYDDFKAECIDFFFDVEITSTKLTLNFDKKDKERNYPFHTCQNRDGKPININRELDMLDGIAGSGGIRQLVSNLSYKINADGSLVDNNGDIVGNIEKKGTHVRIFDKSNFFGSRSEVNVELFLLGKKLLLSYSIKSLNGHIGSHSEEGGTGFFETTFKSVIDGDLDKLN